MIIVLRLTLFHAHLSARIQGEIQNQNETFLPILHFFSLNSFSSPFLEMINKVLDEDYAL